MACSHVASTGRINFVSFEGARATRQGLVRPPMGEVSIQTSMVLGSIRRERISSSRYVIGRADATSRCCSPGNGSALLTIRGATYSEAVHMLRLVDDRILPVEHGGCRVDVFGLALLDHLFENGELLLG